MTPTLDPQEARTLGVIQEINRLLLHPRGLALYVDIETGNMGIYTDPDPEGWEYGGDIWGEDAILRAANFEGLLKPEREQRLGYVVQPLPPSG